MKHEGDPYTLPWISDLLAELVNFSASSNFRRYNNPYRPVYITGELSKKKMGMLSYLLSSESHLYGNSEDFNTEKTYLKGITITYYNQRNVICFEYSNPGMCKLESRTRVETIQFSFIGRTNQ